MHTSTHEDDGRVASSVCFALNEESKDHCALGLEAKRLELTQKLQALAMRVGTVLLGDSFEKCLAEEGLELGGEVAHEHTHKYAHAHTHINVHTHTHTHTHTNTHAHNKTPKNTHTHAEKRALLQRGGEPTRGGAKHVCIGCPR